VEGCGARRDVVEPRRRVRVPRGFGAEGRAQGARAACRGTAQSRSQTPLAINVDRDGMRARGLAVPPVRVPRDGGGEGGAQGALDGLGRTAPATRIGFGHEPAASLKGAALLSEAPLIILNCFDLLA
jgi:hypothetical protein